MVNQHTIIEYGVLVELGATFVYPGIDQNAKLEVEVRYALVVGIQVADVKSVWPGTNYRTCWNSAWCKGDGDQQTQRTIFVVQRRHHLYIRAVLRQIV